MPDPNSAPRGRYAPSPTGELHLGNAWAALVAWWSIRSRNGGFVLRMEDLDPARSRPDHARQILQDLAWLGLDWDEGPDLGGPYGAPFPACLLLAVASVALISLVSGVASSVKPT